MCCTKLSRLLIAFIFIGYGSGLNAQRRTPKPVPTTINTSPKLVVGVVVDQMRYDYLTRFWGHYGSGGFKRLIRDGYNCKNNHFNYAQTSTGPGHASIYSGSTPSSHGIIANQWYDKTKEREVYCVSDDAYRVVGAENGLSATSPNRMNVTTITDQLRLHTQMRGKVISISIKDRGAVLPGGHTANGAYWFYGGNKGHWISSSYYMEALPDWVARFNASNAVESYIKTWDTLKDIRDYVESGPDNNSYETAFADKSLPTFPYDLPALWKSNGNYEMIKATPYGNSITTDFALASLEGEELGTDANTDFLAISYSSTDYIGHLFGVDSKEIQDAYLRLDADLERLLKGLDKAVGEGQYTLFLTSDHGAIPVPAYLKDLQIPAGYQMPLQLSTVLEEYVKFAYGNIGLIKNISNNQVFLDHKIIKNLDLSLEQVQESMAQELLEQAAIDMVYTAYQMQHHQYTHGMPYLLQNGYNQKRSGDILIVAKAGTADYGPTGSTHGSPYPYDTHVPLIFYGKGVQKGNTAMRTEIPDIAPTLAVMLGISFPNGTTGNVISEVLK